MKAHTVTFSREGAPEVLEIREVDVPDPGPLEVRVRVEAIGLNRAEALWRAGCYYERPSELPAKLGYEAAGTIESVGSSVTGMARGTPISIVPSFSMRDYGVYGELVNVPASSVVARPHGQSAVDGAAIWMSGITAYGGLIHIAKLRAGDFVLITAASGSVGLTAIEVARRVGASAIATTRTASKRERLLSAGASHVIVTGEESISARVLDITSGRGADLVFDALAGAGVSELAAATRQHGQIIVYGFLDTSNEPGSFGKSVTPLPVTNFTSTMRWFAAVLEISGDSEANRRARQFILSGIESGALRSTIDKTFRFGDIVEAHRYLEKSGQVGKVVVTI